MNWHFLWVVFAIASVACFTVGGIRLKQKASRNVIVKDFVLGAVSALLAIGWLFR
jgi:NADH:ubiquinone oxidoreductase subunit 2 (subunit N)